MAQVYNKIMAKELEEPELKVLTAGVIYLLMKNDYCISYSVRTQWFLDHLKKELSVVPREDMSKCDSELTVVSVIPQEANSEWRPETSHVFKYLVVPSSSLVFLSQTYSIVYCLDMSPSLSAVDIQHGQVMVDDVFLVLQRSLDGITRPLIIPGSCCSFRPAVYVTVIAHTPFFTSPAQQVLLQGYRVTRHNMAAFLGSVQHQLELLEDTVAHVSGIAHDQLEALRAESEKLVGDLFEDSEMSCSSVSHIPMVTPDSGFVNMLRYGMLALRLLPESSSPNLIIITDGIIAAPDVYVFDSVLSQLRTSSTACSFLQVGSLFHPHCCRGMVPYVDLMQFIAHATGGAYMSHTPLLTMSETELNIYHSKFLAWSFKKPSWALTAVGDSSDIVAPCLQWHVSNACFYGSREPRLLCKKQLEGNLSTSLISVLCCRLKEGYSFKNVRAVDSRMELSLVLPWKNHIYIEYVASSSVWTSAAQSTPCSVAFSVSIRAPYEFLHDITCKLKKPFQSQYRQAVVSRFWATLKSLTQSDQLLVHLDSFATNPAAHTVPESIRSGMPVFYLPANSSIPVLSSTELTCPVFAQFWRPICMLDPSVWHKWLQTHRLGLLLAHDRPLPRHLHLSNPSGRFQVVQCRQAAAALYAMLKDVSTFVLIENHSYVKLIGGDPPGFYMMRATSKLPYVVINVAFLGRTPCSVRHEIVRQLKKRMTALSVPQRPNATGRLGCCMLLRKPVEKILVRYERMPGSLNTVVFPDGTQPTTSTHVTEIHASNPGLVTTLSRYLHHRRWIWAVQDGTSSPLGTVSVAKILAIITKMRLQEGFHFAHSAAGIVNMVLEVDMKGTVSEMNQDQAAVEPCVIQYVLFPPHAHLASSKESGSEDEGTDDLDTEPALQLISEVWIEPQHGSVVGSPPERRYMEGLPYFQLADKMFAVDAECISSLLAFEQLSLMCGEPDSQAPPTLAAPAFAESLAETISGLSAQALNNASLPEVRIQHIPFEFNLLSVLPTCHQAEQLYSTFSQGPGIEEPNQLFCTILHESLKLIHDRELFLGSCDSRSFLQQVDDRPRDQPLPFPWSSQSRKDTPRWRCYARGIAANRVTLTFVPASYNELRILMSPNECNKAEEPWVARARATSWGAVSELRSRRKNRIRTFSMEVRARDESMETSSPRPQGPQVTLIMPIYVYDCSLAVLVDALVLKQAAKLSVKDTFRDFSYAIQESSELAVGERGDDDTKRSGSDEPKSDSSESVSLEATLKEQCRLVSSVVCRCFVNSLFRALHLGHPVAPGDVQSAVAECEEALIEIDITDYLSVVCGHLKDFRAQEVINVVPEDWSTDPIPHNFPLSSVPANCTCGDLARLHNQIKDSFKDILQQTFRRVPSYPELYFCSPTPVKTPLAECSLDDSNELKEEKSDCETESIITEEEEDPGPVSPFFLHLTCSLSCGNKISSCSVASLPTCLAQLHSAYETTESLDLAQFKVTLDVLCLTLPPDPITPVTCSAPEDSDSTTPLHVLRHLANHQRKAVESGLRQVEWLIRDETAAALLDFPVSESALSLVADHVADSVLKPSCLLESIPLRFVSDHELCHSQFLDMLDCVDICGYRVVREGSYYYLTTKKPPDQTSVNVEWDAGSSPNVSQVSSQDDFKFDSKEDCASECFCFDEANDGFWLVLQVTLDQVITFFHHRALATENMDGVRRIQERAVCILQGLVKTVNQTLLLNNLHSKRFCDPLLESEGSNEETWRNTPKFKDGTETSDMCPEFEPGCFNCDVVWETHLVLHPRLKSGPGFSRGIQALRGVLNRFSVNNRDNMFVYQDNSEHVFYLRLHENLAVSTPRRGYEDNSPTNVSRSSSLASLNAASPGGLGIAEREETVILRVHGISPAGPQIQRDLVQVLQNRLDDAVLEVLSVMLARNPMCKLTPEDVGFVQKPGRPADQTIRFTIQEHAYGHLAALAFYLRQNLLQFVHQPKYTDPRPEAHFCDTSEQAVPESDLFLYNQSPASGSKGIACLALALLDAQGRPIVHLHYPKPLLDTDTSDLHFENFTALTESHLVVKADNSDAPVAEFRVWQRGRVNEPLLAEKLRRAVSHAHWDLLTEFRLLTTALPDKPPLPNKALPAVEKAQPLTSEKPLVDDKSQLINPVGLPEKTKDMELDLLPYANRLANLPDVPSLPSTGLLPDSALLADQTKLSDKVLTPVESSLRDPSSVPDEESLLDKVSVTGIMPGPDNPSVRGKDSEIDDDLISNASVTEHFSVPRVSGSAEKTSKEDLSAPDSLTRDLTITVEKIILSDDPTLIEMTPTTENLGTIDKTLQAEKPVGPGLGREQLSTVFHLTALPWFEFALELATPSIKRHLLKLERPHALSTVARELAVMVQANAVDTDVWLFRSEHSLTPHGQTSFISWALNESLDSAGPNISIMLIGRNNRQWRACLADKFSLDPDILHPKAQKAYHKFTPLLETKAEGEVEKFVPRQRLVLAVANSQSVTLFTYNWSKERSESLGKQLLTLGAWLAARTQLLANAVTQKMGLFHTRRCRDDAAAQPPEWDQLLKFSPSGLRERKTTVRRDLYRDSKPSHLGNDIPNANAGAFDPVQFHAMQLQDLRANLVNKENRKKLHVMWQTRGATPNIPLAEDMILLFRQHSRIIHYCLTPLLFLPRWRVGSAATRDHKLRYDSPGSFGESTSADVWHQQLCASFVTEYKQYLQTLGFIPIQAEPQSPHRNRAKADKGGESLPIPGITRPGSHECYLQKSLLGGILLLELSMNEPFFHTKLHALECSRLQNKLSSALLMSQFTLSFVDECDRMKVLLHLHSFTYDYHLRCVQAYLSTQPAALLRSGFHLTHFLQDFLKYYEKAPNFARNLVHADVIEVEKAETTAGQLYSYLLSHEATYNMEVFRMVAGSSDAPLDNEFVLVQLWQTPLVTYRDSSDMKQSDDYDVTLVVWHDDSESETQLKLDYFVILTSRRELFPKLETERKLGKFCTVSTAFAGDSERDAVMEIRRESVNYLGYYSSHEQLMARVMREQATLARSRIQDMVSRGGVDCHTHLLWNKLQCGGLHATEFRQLLKLSMVQSLAAVDERLGPLLGQPPAFYQGLAKALATKYADQHRVMLSSDGMTTYLCVLHPRHLDAFMLLSVDQLASRGDLCAVYRKKLEGEEPSAQQQEFIRTDIQALIEGFVNTCCYHLWVGLS